MSDDEFTFEQEDKDGNRTEVVPADEEQARLMDAIAETMASFGVTGIVWADDNSDEEES